MFSLHGRGSRCAQLVALTLATGKLAACASVAEEAAVRTVEVDVPIAVSCVPEHFPKAPGYPDSDAALKAAPDGAERYQLLQAGRILRAQRAAEVEPVIEACRQVLPPSRIDVVD